jgi:diguanylate cyclase (GGDEF)-like protein
MPFRKTQSLNEWVVMLDAIYGGSQNYAKTPYEIHAHLTEVCGIFAKQFFKRKDARQAATFLPKIFAWSVALLKKLRPEQANLEEIVLRKFPNSCPYCLKKPCLCWTGEKPSLQDEQLRDAFYQRATGVRRSVNDFQLMFREIYLQSWVGELDLSTHSTDIVRKLFIRLIEEVAEVGEALRFHHLYPENFENEFADLMAWWFAIVSVLPASDDRPLLAEDYLWRAYPGHCPDCQMVPCLCRPGPVRQLMSRPIPGHDHRFDSLTSLLNQAAFHEDIGLVIKGEVSLVCPSACVRVDVDHFKSVNDTYGHSAGDEALRQIAALLRRTVRERDRVYRISGDEYGILCANFTEEEAAGAMRRVCAALGQSPIRWVGQDGTAHEFIVSVSVGVAELSAPNVISASFEAADKAAYASKQAGGARVTKASALPLVSAP